MTALAGSAIVRRRAAVAAARGEHRRGQANRSFGIRGGGDALPFVRKRRAEFVRIRAESRVDFAGPQFDAHFEVGAADGELEIDGMLVSCREPLRCAQHRLNRAVRGTRQSDGLR